MSTTKAKKIRVTQEDIDQAQYLLSKYPDDAFRTNCCPVARAIARTTGIEVRVSSNFWSKFDDGDACGRLGGADAFITRFDMRRKVKPCTVVMYPMEDRASHGG